MKHLITALLLAAILASNACLQIDLKPTLYLEEDGSVTWVLNLRLDDDERREKAARGEADGIDLDQEIADMETTLWQLGAETVTTRIIRDQPPYNYITRATFADVGPILSVLFEDWPGLKWQESREAGRRVMRFSVDPAQPVPGELMGMEIVAVAGEVGRFGESSHRVLLSAPSDWHGMTFKW